MVEQRPFSCWANAWNFLQARLTQIALAPLAVRSDRETVGFIPQPLNEIENRVAWGQFEWSSPRQKKRLPAGIAVQSLGDRHHR